MDGTLTHFRPSGRMSHASTSSRCLFFGIIGLGDLGDGDSSALRVGGAGNSGRANECMGNDADDSMLAKSISKSWNGTGEAGTRALNGSTA